VAAVGANDADDAFAPDHFAVFAKLFYGCANFHFLVSSKTIRPFEKSNADISRFTWSPGRNAAASCRRRGDTCPRRRCPLTSSTRKSVACFSTSTTVPARRMTSTPGTYNCSNGPFPEKRSAEYRQVTWGAQQVFRLLTPPRFPREIRRRRGVLPMPLSGWNQAAVAAR
jgi:hypothetical protein